MEECDCDIELYQEECDIEVCQEEESSCSCGNGCFYCLDLSWRDFF